MKIRKAELKDLSRIAEIFVFNNRINYFPIFHEEAYSFGEMQVVPMIDQYFKKEEILNRIYVYVEFVSSDGFEIFVGRSNSQNDELTTKIARRTDIWLHTKTVHGSHVIISCEGVEPPQRTIEEAASLAAYYSQAREGGKTAVDYTMVRFVRKPSGSMPGKVIYTDYSTVMAESDEALCEKLKRN